MTPHKTLASLCLSLVAAAALAGAPTPAPRDTLYARLGGAAKVSAIVEQAVTRVAGTLDADSRQRVKALLTARICTLAGGGCRTDVNAFALNDADFPALVAELRGAMRAEHVPLAVRNELLELLAPPPRDVASL
jgi:hypothetical protein